MTDFSHLIPEAAAALKLSNAGRFSFIERDKIIYMPITDLIFGRLDEIFSHPRVIRPPNVIICGISGIGKSLTLNEYMRRHRSRRSKIKGILIVPVCHVEYPPEPSSRWLASAISRKLGYMTPLPTRILDVFELLLERLAIAQCRLIIIEEVNQLIHWGSSSLREFYGLLRWLSNQTGIPIALVGTEDVPNIIAGDIQLVRRFEIVELTPMELCAEFGGFVQSYISTLPLANASRIDQEFLRRLHVASEGITDTVVKILQRAAKRAILSGAECISADDIRSDARAPPPVVSGRKVMRRSKRRT